MLPANRSMVEVQTSTLAEGLTVRPAQEQDLLAWTALTRQCEIELYGVPETTLADMQRMWTDPGFRAETDTWVISTTAGKLIAAASISQRAYVRAYATFNVHAEYRHQGIEDYLLQALEERARQFMPLAPPETRVTLRVSCSSLDHDTPRILAAHRFTLVRRIWRMAIILHEAPPAAHWAEGIQVRTFVPGMERSVYEADEEIFKDHWGYIPTDYAAWRHVAIERADFDPSLWFLAMDGEQIAGIALCNDEQVNGGWVHVLGVGRAWRRQGIGQALLLHVFAEFYRRGRNDIYLSVDSQNLTGATRLYERVGMHVDRQHDRYEKELRPGKELSVQSLTD